MTKSFIHRFFELWGEPRAVVEQLRQDLRLHDRAMESSSCGIVIADAHLPDMPLIYINEAFTRITGYDKHDTIGRNCRFLQGDDRDQAPIADLRRAIDAGEDSTITIRNYRKTGELFWNELFTSPIRDANGRVTHFVGVQTDVTHRVEAEAALRRQTDSLASALAELKQTQAQLIHAEKMNALGQLVAGIAHEINNPVAFVNSNLHSLQRTLDDLFATYTRLEAIARASGIGADALQAVRDAGDIDYLTDDTRDMIAASLDGLRRVRRIVEGLRTFSRLDEAQMKLATLQENLDSTLMLASVMLKDRVRVVFDGIDALPPLYCYPAELNQVFMNLIVNAAQAIDGAGTITIAGRDAGDCIVLTFSDTGVGIPADVLPRIFEPFFTTKPVGRGTGLGLAIASRIITEDHRGTIVVESTPGVGTTFTLTLPKDIRR